MKKRYFNRLHILITAALLLAPSMASAQTELLLDLMMNDEYSIVRHLNSDTCIIYSNSPKDNRFYMVDMGNTSIVVVKSLLDFDLKILDFEIYDSTLYFCGITNKTDSLALFGYFSLINYPFDSVFIDTVETLKAFKKLDVFEVENQIHVVMTADMLVSGSTIVDTRKVTANNWQYEIMAQENISHVFDDVAVTDNLVVFTSRFYYGLRYGTAALWYFPKPPSAGISLFYNTSNINKFLLENNANSPILIEHISGDKFDIACNSEDIWLTVDKFDGITYNQSIRVSRLLKELVLDIKFNHFLGHSIVLAGDESASPGESILWDITTPSPSPGPLYYKYLFSEKVNSIDNLPAPNNTIMVGSGHNMATNFHFYKIDPIGGTGCIPIVLSKGEVADYDNHIERVDIELSGVYHPMSPLKCSREDNYPNIECE